MQVKDRCATLGCRAQLQRADPFAANTANRAGLNRLLIWRRPAHQGDAS